MHIIVGIFAHKNETLTQYNKLYEPETHNRSITMAKRLNWSERPEFYAYRSIEQYSII